MITQNLFNQKVTYIGMFAFLLTFNIFSQDIVSTSNEEITTITVDFAFDEEVTDSKNNPKEHMIDNLTTTKWAGNLGNTDGEAALIFNLGGTYDVAEIQHLSVAKSDPYAFQVLVSTDGTNYTDVYGGAIQQSNLDFTFKQFTFPSVQTGVTHVKLICFGRINATTEANTSAWNTIDEIKFFKQGATASIEDSELNLSTLYPVPASDELFLTNFNNKVDKIEIFNLQGKKLLTKQVNLSNESIHTSTLSNGVYLVKLSDSKNTSVGKLITIQH